MKMEELWIGLAKVRPYPKNNSLKGAVGAFVNVIGLASSASIFKQKVRNQLRELEFALIEIEDIQLLDQQSKTEENILRMMNSAKDTNQLQFGNFHTFMNEDE